MKNDEIDRFLAYMDGQEQIIDEKDKTIDELRQSVSDWKSSYEELRYEDTLRDFFDATNGE